MNFCVTERVSKKLEKDLEDEVVSCGLYGVGHSTAKRGITTTILKSTCKRGIAMTGGNNVDTIRGITSTHFANHLLMIVDFES